MPIPCGSLMPTEVSIDHQGTDRQRVMPGGDRDQLVAVGDRAHFLQRPRIDEMLLEDGVRAGAVGPDDPQRLDEGPAALVVFPARVADQAVVQAVRQVVAVLVDAQAADVAAVGPHHVEVAAGFVFVVLVALQRRAAAFGDKGDVAAGQVRGVQVAPLAVRELPQPLAVDADLEDVDRLLARGAAGSFRGGPASRRAAGRSWPWHSRTRRGRRRTTGPCRGRGPGRARR